MFFIGCAPFYFFSLNFASRHKPIAKISCPNGLNHAAIPLQSCRSSATVVVTSICLNASDNFPHLLRMAHDRRRLRPAYTGRWAVLLRLFGFFSSPEPRSGIEPRGDISGFFAGARAGSLRGSRGRLHHGPCRSPSPYYQRDHDERIAPSVAVLLATLYCLCTILYCHLLLL